ncbi:hypothetical protein FE810_01015 [Thalassotalea litorea]|uniref:Cytochrome c-552/4 domain-containing protein n=1 Tax=Thalassotalea litorea TaxID=2020715 RepID=A0A5R9J061_9GAMM|nr:multiheme c-type cytochrome [Thalassotalea litorea]TLU67558.1 hypothetical protein FE810_01015 [Thalassotalea litorea]
MKFSTYLISFLLFIAFSGVTLANTGAPEQCTNCHQQQVTAWQQSDHAKAMAKVSEQTVLGNFNGVSVQHFSQTAKFFQKQNKYFMSLNHENNVVEYEAKFVFGHFPLQQYLIEADGGRLQVFPFAWDSRNKDDGGQRWYPMYADEDIKSADRLHWQQPMQNWNGMCADCHSDGLTRNYDASKNTFSSHYDNINVGCQSCHGDMENHQSQSADPYSALVQAPSVTRSNQDIGQWLRMAGEDVASWQGEKRDNQFMDSCFACHSLRSPLTDGIAPGTAFLDQFSPSMLAHPLYYSDGQIKEEVYVYGSFLQSKMFKAGVNCIDCHDKHTMKIKVEGNGLCLQCHSPEKYQQTQHTGHPLDQPGGQCVDCHMSETTYMGVDDRRDHSFKIPRPDLSSRFSSPNACTKCHDDKSNSWASSELRKLHGKPKALSSDELHYRNLQHGNPITLQQHLNVINSDSLNEIHRASALRLLPGTTQSINESMAKPWIQSDEPLIRLAMAHMGFMLPADQQQGLYMNLLDDEYKAVRVAAAQQVINLGVQFSPSLANAISELFTANEQNRWRGEGGLNQSMLHIALGEYNKAQQALEQAIAADPYFDPAYVNLADLYRGLNQVDKELTTYQTGLKAVPKSAMLHYGYGMHLVRAGDKKAALQSFEKASQLDTENVQYVYVYLLSLDSVGNTREALNRLKQILAGYNNDPQLVQLGLSFSQKLQDINSYQFFMTKQRR